MQRITTNLKTELRQNRNLVFVVFVFCMMAVLSFCATSNMQDSMAADATKFQPGNIISDAVMANSSAMSLQEIQNFLDSKNKCDNRDYNLYLQYTKAHPNIQWHWEGEPYNGHFVCLAQERFSDGVEIGYGQTAAEIIYEAAQEYRINPQVLIVLLQKESSLITDKVPNTHDYRQATGYGCPDTAACDSKYYGFKNQIYRAAELFRYTLDHGYSLYPEKRTVYVGYHPNSSCGGSQIYIENRATSALYRYTPYQPNGAAIAAGYGTGNACSAYGNRNFYLYFTDWFGSTQVKVEGELVTIPDGEYSLVSAVGSQRSLAISGTNAQLAELNMNDQSQRFRIERDTSTNYYQLTNLRTGQPVIAHSKTPEQGTNVGCGASTTCSRWWKIYQTKDGHLIFESSCNNGMVLDVARGSNMVGTNVEIYVADGTKAQKWKLVVGKTIDDGVYTISSNVNDKKMIDLEGGWNFNGNNIQIWDDNKANAQKWRVQYDLNKHYYTLTNPDSGKRFDLAGAKTQAGTNIGIWESVDACSQYWQIIPNGDAYTIISTCAANMTVDLAGGATKNATNIQLWSHNGADAQKWRFHNQQVLQDGNYEILSSVDSKYAIDIEGGWNRNAVNVNLYQANSVAEAQLWNIRYNSATGDYTLLNQTKDRSFDLEGGYTKMNTNIQIWANNNACAQRWTIVSNPDATYTMISTCTHEGAVDLKDGLANNTSNIRLWTVDGTAAQKWIFKRK